MVTPVQDNGLRWQTIVRERRGKPTTSEENDRRRALVAVTTEADEGIFDFDGEEWRGVCGGNLKLDTRKKNVSGSASNKITHPKILGFLVISRDFVDYMPIIFIALCIYYKTLVMILLK